VSERKDTNSTSAGTRTRAVIHCKEGPYIVYSLGCVVCEVEGIKDHSGDPDVITQSTKYGAKL
jgi:hypothetical protein